MLFSSHGLFPSPASSLWELEGLEGTAGCASAAWAQVEADGFVLKKKTNQHQALSCPSSCWALVWVCSLESGVGAAGGALVAAHAVQAGTAGDKCPVPLLSSSGRF